jgi:hypothetical protein
MPDDVWVLTNANGLGGTPTWLQLSTVGSAPQSTAYETESYDAGTNRLIVYGGCYWSCSPSLNGVFVLTNANGLGGPPTWSQLTVTNPQARDSHSAIYQAAGDRLIAFGGDFAFPSTDQNDTRVLTNASGLASPSTWSTLATAGGPPPVRISHTATYDPTSDRMTVFGGDEFVRCCAPNYVINDYNDTWVLSGASGLGGTATWTLLTPAGPMPSPRSYHSAVYDQAGNRMYVYGGAEFNEATQSYAVNGELWMLDNANGQGGTPIWTQITAGGSAPGPLSGHTAAMDQANQRMMLLGGSDQSTPSSRVFVLALAPANRSPDCSAAVADPGTLWPPNHKFRTVTVGGVSDPDGDQVTVTVTGVTQDEALNGLGDGDTSPDAATGPSSNQVFVRAERSGTGDGRVYHVAFTASDGKGGTCSGVVTVGVPHDQGPKGGPVDSGLVVNSFGP